MIGAHIESTLERLLPDLAAAGPVLLAMRRQSSRDLLFAPVPSPDPQWIPASQWQAICDAPVVPLHVGDRQELRVGKTIQPAALSGLRNREQQLDYLRWRTDLLAAELPAGNEHRAMEPVAAAVSPEKVERELNALPPQCRIIESGEFTVFLAEAARIPSTLAEIGRLREIAFRAVGEGTGRAYDLDRFDSTYRHLLVWNQEAREIAGAYRLSLTGAGPSVLYTATLFHYSPEFLERMGPAIELGRSFIRLEYQKSFAPLLLLWKGIGRFVAAHPNHTTLFGPVSISNQYQSPSRELMISYLERHELLAELAQFVRPRNAPRLSGEIADFCPDMDALSGIVADLEPTRQGVPVLLRHYLRLGGKLLGFNVDPDFSSALDGLIVVDLTRTDPRLLERYLGKVEAASLLLHKKGTRHGTH